MNDNLFSRYTSCLTNLKLASNNLRARARSLHSPKPLPTQPFLTTTLGRLRKSGTLGPYYPFLMKIRLHTITKKTGILSLSLVKTRPSTSSRESCGRILETRGHIIVGMALMMIAQDFLLTFLVRYCRWQRHWERRSGRN